jgi:hypothetical protein
MVVKEEGETNDEKIMSKCSLRIMAMLASDQTTINQCQERDREDI